MVSGGITPTPTYDANGNQTSATPATLTWNALNQPITVNSTTATYDALGRMVEKGVGTTYTQFVYNPDGTSLAVYSGGLTKGTISLPGGSTAVYNASGLNFIRHKDWLGSSRLATTWAHAVYAKEAYAPFGETYNEAGTADRSFTGQDQNVVTNSGGTGVYDYLFRKYDPSAGRWLSPDPYGWGAVSLHRPQSLNRYAYVQNGPLTLIDPDGTSIGCDDEDGCDSGDGDLGEGDIPGFSPAPPDPGPTPPWDTPALDPDPGAFFDGGAGLSYDNGYRGDDDPSICDLASGCFEYYLQTQMWPASSATVEVASAPNNPQQPQPQQPKPEPKPGWCTALNHAGNTTVALGGATFLWGILADAGVVTAPAGVALQASGGIGMAVGGIGIGIADAGLALGICH